MSLFQKTVITKYLNTQNKERISLKWDSYKSHFLNPKVQEDIKSLKEEQYQGEFLEDLFVKILGYTKPASSSETQYNLTTEYKNVKDSKKADGAIIIDAKVKAVIELKGTNTTDLGKVEAQAFGYKNNQPECVYVITSNFEKLRFYIDNAIEHLEFNLFTLTQEEFSLLYLCLGYENIANDVAKKIKEESLSEEDVITKKLYKDYSIFKRELYQSLVALNPAYEPLELFKKSQKLLDRFLFLLFGEDRNLLPPNSVKLILSQWNQLRELDEYTPLYDRFKKYFGYLNTGYKGKQYDVFAYNGGLFKPDEILDSIIIDDNLLYKHTLKLSEYDFASEVDVNILGHIFENSLNELDEIKAQLEGAVIDKSKTKRKKDGVFYTPKYITKYIVENTVGKLCEGKKIALEIIEEEYYTDKKRQKKTIKGLIYKLEEYRKWLLQLTICDPACGSGAFLNQALDFLIDEHRYVDELQAKLFGDAMVLSDVEKSILENNLFGVDLNEESVEIAKLSLWLRTAQPNRKLNDLNNNIKCGNSLIDDVAIAGDKAFNWQNEFPKVFGNGGFDVVIGNPPWGAKIDDLSTNFLLKNYPLVPSKLKDTYLYFMLLSLKKLKANGILGFIVPNTWLLINNTSEFRKYLLSFKIYQIVDHGDDIFEDAIVESSTIVMSNEIKENGKVLAIKQRGNKEIINHYVEKSIWLSDNLNRIVIELSILNHNLIKRLETISKPFEDSSEIIFGIKPYQVGHGIPKQTREMVDNRIYHSNTKINNEWFPLVTGTDVNRYKLDFNNNEFILYGKNLMYSSNELKIKSEKILLRRTSHDLRAFVDNNLFYPQNSLFVITSSYNLKYLVSLFNSKLFDFIYKTKCPQVGKVFAEVKPSIIKSLPIVDIEENKQLDFANKVDLIQNLNKELQEQSQKFKRTIQRKFELEDLSKKLQDWYKLTYPEFIKELAKKKVKLSLSQEAEWEDYFIEERKKALELKSQIDATDKAIDMMVYELYGLTSEEIEIVENS
jgi:hypothetical protein